MSLGRGAFVSVSRLSADTLRPSHVHSVTTIREDLLPGNHTLTCEVLEETLDEKGGTEFRLISVLTD